jgi:hypothetical protein
MGIADIKFHVVRKRFAGNELSGGVNEVPALIHPDRITGKIIPAHQGAKGCTGAAPHLQHLAAGTGYKFPRIAVKQAGKYLVLGPALKSRDEALNCRFFQFIDESVWISRRHGALSAI